MSDEARAAAYDVVASLEKAFNAHDPIALSEHFADEAAWSTVMGHRLAGRREIAAFGRETIHRLADQYARYEVVRLVAIRPDVVAVNVVQTPTNESGEPVDGTKGAALYVVAAQHDGWKIVAGQNTFLGGPPA